jgi:hypothetical protein
MMTRNVSHLPDNTARISSDLHSAETEYRRDLFVFQLPNYSVLARPLRLKDLPTMDRKLVASIRMVRLLAQRYLPQIASNVPVYVPTAEDQQSVRSDIYPSPVRTSPSLQPFSPYRLPLFLFNLRPLQNMSIRHRHQYTAPGQHCACVYSMQ